MPDKPCQCHYEGVGYNFLGVANNAVDCGDALSNALSELRKIPAFVALERNAELRNGKLVDYKWNHEYEFYTQHGVVYINPLWERTAYTADLGDFEERVCGHLNDDAWFKCMDDYIEKNDVHPAIGVQVKFSLQRIVVHELIHNTLPFAHSELDVIKQTNEFMKQYYGEFQRVDHHIHWL